MGTKDWVHVNNVHRVWLRCCKVFECSCSAAMFMAGKDNPTLDLPLLVSFEVQITGRTRNEGYLFAGLLVRALSRSARPGPARFGPARLSSAHRSRPGRCCLCVPNHRTIKIQRATK